MRLLLLVSVFYGAIKTAASAWALGDMGVGLMAWLNLVAIILLRKPALRAFRDYQAQRRQGLDPVFDPEKLGIRNAGVWMGDGEKKAGSE